MSDGLGLKGKLSVKIVTFIAIMQIVLGSLTSFSGFALFLAGNRKEFNEYGAYGLSGIFGGAWFIVTGILGLASSRRSTNFVWNNSHMAFSISAILVVLFGILASTACIINLNECFKTYWEGLPHTQFYCNKKKTGKTFAWMMLVFNILELFVATTASVFTCLFYGTCCKCCLHCCSEDKHSTDYRRYQENETYVSRNQPIQYGHQPSWVAQEQMTHQTSQNLPTKYPSTNTAPSELSEEKYSIPEDNIQQQTAP